MKRNKIIFWVCFVIFIAAVGFGGWYFLSQQMRGNVYDDVAEKYTETVPPAATPGPEPTLQPVTATPEPVVIPVDFAGLKQVNPEIYAWIRIVDTPIDYPIVQRPSDDAYYLDHTIEGAAGLPGSIYTESMCGTDFTFKNTVIYGHNMRNGSMFGSLKKYQDKAYMDAHPDIIIYTPDHVRTYRIFCAVTYDNRHLLKSYDFTQDLGLQTFLDDLSRTRNMASYINSAVPVTGADRIITLSTCNGNSDQRFLIGAVLIDEK